MPDEEGSMKVMGFEKYAALDEYLKNEPCETKDVWQKIDAKVTNAVLENGRKR